jgi:2-polyprenyl-3-methyl-5-hydroxy-6-metoxy-1,4-benzoquinol methylase
MKMKAIQQSEKFWDKRSKKYDKQIKKHKAIYEKMFDSTRSLLTNSDVVLDFACAGGEVSLDIAPHVKQVHGIDTSVKMIELANQKAHDRQINNIQFNQIDVFDQRLESNSFSAILAFHIFHLVDDAPKVLARLNDLLAPGGLLISQTPCLGERGWFFKSMISFFQKLGLAPTIRSLRITELESLVSKSNFEIFETEIRWEKYADQWIVARKLK